MQRKKTAIITARMTPGTKDLIQHQAMIDQVRKIVNRFLWQGQCREWDAIDKEKRLKTTSMVSRHLV